MSDYTAAANATIKRALQPVSEAITALSAMSDLIAQEELWPAPVDLARRTLMLRTLVRGLGHAQEEAERTIDLLLGAQEAEGPHVGDWHRGQR